jgi:hypothetical protein
MLYCLDSNAICTCWLLKFVYLISASGLKKLQRRLHQQDKRQCWYQSKRKVVQESEVNTTWRLIDLRRTSKTVQKWSTTGLQDLVPILYNCNHL